MLKNRMSGQPFDVDAVSTETDLREADSRAGPNMLMQMMYVEFYGPNPGTGVAFFEYTSDQNKICGEAGIEGKACVQLVQTSNREPEAWNTKAYWVLVVDRKAKDIRYSHLR